MGLTHGGPGARSNYCPPYRVDQRRCPEFTEYPSDFCAAFCFCDGRPVNVEQLSQQQQRMVLLNPSFLRNTLIGISICLKTLIILQPIILAIKMTIINISHHHFYLMEGRRDKKKATGMLYCIRKKSSIYRNLHFIHRRGKEHESMTRLAAYRSCKVIITVIIASGNAPSFLCHNHHHVGY